MRRFVPLLALTAALVPLMAAVPISRIKEPNAVFAFDVEKGNRVTAVLFDRLQSRPLDNLDVTLDVPVSGAGTNDSVQFSPGSKKIYIRGSKPTGDSKERGSEADLDTYILEGGFDWKDPVEIFSCTKCSVGGWIVHPTQPKLYVSLKDPLANGDEFRAAKLIEITLAPKHRTRVVTRIPFTHELRITPDGASLYTFGIAENSRQAYGELVTVGLTERKRSKKVVNLPESDAYGRIVLSSTSDISPDALEMAYHFGVMDLRGDATETVMKNEEREMGNSVIGWSRSSRKMLFQLASAIGENDEPVVYDRDTHAQWTLPLKDAEFLQWSPSETALLYDRWGDIGYYDLKKREWVHVFDAGTNLTGGAAWVTLPTKRVPKR